MSCSISLLLSSCRNPSFGRTHLRQTPLSSPPHLSPISLPSPSRKSSFSQFSTSSSSRTFLGFTLNATSDGETTKGENIPAAIDRSTLPDRFRDLTKEAPDPPLRWPWIVALFFGLYAWRAVLWELSNWKSAATAIIGAVVYVGKLALGLLYKVIGPPITGLLWCVDFLVNSVRAAYSGVVAAAPVTELIWLIALAAAVAAVAEAAEPGSVNSQQNFLTAAGVLGYSAVAGNINGVVFWGLLTGSYFFSRYGLKKGVVAAALPAAAVLVSVGETWLRALTLGGFVCLGLLQRSIEGGEAEKAVTAPLPLRLAALAIGVHVVAKWLRYRHLTWMIV